MQIEMYTDVERNVEMYRDADCRCIKRDGRLDVVVGVHINV